MEDKYPLVREMNDQQRISVVKEIFATATSKYDFLNHLLSLRRDIAWRRYTARRLRPGPSALHLDIATGTGDMAIETARQHPQLTIIGIDFVREMLDVGRRKIGERSLNSHIHISLADAMALPFPDASFDTVSIAFGIRNIPDRRRALDEMRRVLRPGGSAYILEMTFTRSKLFKKFFYFYLNKILPLLAKPFSKNPQAYYYLADSIMNFPAPDEFAHLMEQAGFHHIEMKSLTLGITYLHIGQKP